MREIVDTPENMQFFIIILNDDDYYCRTAGCVENMIYFRKFTKLRLLAGLCVRRNPERQYQHNNVDVTLICCWQYTPYLGGIKISQIVCIQLSMSHQDNCRSCLDVEESVQRVSALQFKTAISLWVTKRLKIWPQKRTCR